MSRPDPQAAAPTDPTVASSCLDFLLIELVPLAQRITDQLHARDQTLRAEYARSQIFHDQPPPAASTLASTTNTSTATTAAGAGATLSAGGEGNAHGREDGTEGKDSTGPAPASTLTDVSSVGGGAMTDTTAMGGAGGLDDETRDAVFWRLDGMGYRVGQGLVERFSANRPRPQSPLDNIKFICKDLWPLLFRKQIDNLKTNHRGVFVLTDQRFQPISRVSVDRKAGVKASEETLSRAQAYLYFPCGIIRGALAGLGMDVTVHADSSEIPAATFQIKTRGAKA